MREQFRAAKPLMLASIHAALLGIINTIFGHLNMQFENDHIQQLPTQISSDLKYLHNNDIIGNFQCSSTYFIIIYPVILLLINMNV